MKVAVVGAGAIGMYVGALLQGSAGAEEKPSMVFVGRPRLGEEIAKRGHVLVTRPKHAPLQLNAKDLVLVTDEAGWEKEMGDVDVVLVCVKCLGTEEAAKQIKRHCGKREDKPVVVASLQNGVGNAHVLRNELGDRFTVLAGVVEFNAVWDDDAHFHLGTDGNIVLEQLPPASPANALLTALVGALNIAGVPTTTSAAITSVQWGKLLVNLFNAVNAIARKSIEDTSASRAYRTVWALCIEEGRAVAAKAGIEPATSRLPPGLLVPVLKAPDFVFGVVKLFAAKTTPGARSSMLQDLEKGRKTEIDFLNGEVVRVGKEVGVATPVNARVVELVRAQEARGAGVMEGLSPEEVARLFGI